RRFSCVQHTTLTRSYALSLHDALPILLQRQGRDAVLGSSGAYQAERERARRSPLHRLHPVLLSVLGGRRGRNRPLHRYGQLSRRSEEHTSELQSQSNLVCRLLLEKKKK